MEDLTHQMHEDRSRAYDWSRPYNGGGSDDRSGTDDWRRPNYGQQYVKQIVSFLSE